jgi:hypothetical protein
MSEQNSVVAIYATHIVDYELAISMAHHSEHLVAVAK